MFTLKIKSLLLTATVLLLICLVTGAYAASYTFSTANDKLDGASNNSGWWSGNASNSPANADIYMVGTYGIASHHNFFTFDLSSLELTDMLVSSAKLTAPLGQVLGQGLLYTLYDVSTNVNTLNNTGSSSSVDIYNDLGSGTTYGSFAVPTASPFEMNLNSDALAAISNKGWFSIGGSLASSNTGNYYIFGNTLSTPVTLQVETVQAPEPPTAPAAVPEPATLLGFGVPMLMVGLGKIKSLRK